MSLIPAVIPDQGVESATFGNPVADAINLSGGRWRRVATQSIPNNVQTTVTWDTEDHDTDGMIAVPNTTFTIPFDGLWHISWVADTTALINARHICTLFVTSAIAASAGEWRANGYGEARCNLGVSLPLAAGDTFLFAILQVSGGALNYVARLAVSNGINR